MVKSNTKLFSPVFKATVAVAEQSDLAKAVNEGISRFSEGMPVFMKALNELKGIHPFIGGEFFLWYMQHGVTGRVVVVLAFEAAYALYRKRQDNDKKVA